MDASEQVRRMVEQIDTPPARLSISKLRHLPNGDMQVVLSNGATLAGVDVIELRGKRGAHTVLAIEVMGVTVEVVQS